MLAKERQNKIYELVHENNAVITANLADLFDVSIETVRRDLLDMEKADLLTRVHGGAVAKTEMKDFRKLTERNTEHCGEKIELSEKASEFIEEGDIIGIDSGSTAIFLANVIKEKFTKLTVVTHSLDVFNILCNHKDFNVILCGGHYLSRENAFYGHLTLNMFATLHMKKIFIFPTAVSVSGGICDFQSDLCQIQNAMLKSADKVFVLADSSKFEKSALIKLDDMKKEYTYVTDSALADEIRELYKKRQINIIF